MKISFLLVLFILLNATINSQDLLEQKEIELNEKLLQLRAAKTDEEMNRLNLTFKSEMASFLKIEGVFKYQFKHSFEVSAHTPISVLQLTVTVI